MMNAAIAGLRHWRAVLRARVAFVLVIALMIAGLPSHIVTVHVTDFDGYAGSAAVGQLHSHDEVGAPVQHGGHSHEQEVADHSHHFSLIASVDHLGTVRLAEAWATPPQGQLTGFWPLGIEKPPKSVVRI